jgi:D-glycero-D-manno-heptose 1,7-bisphosphate phosphatase
LSPNPTPSPRRRPGSGAAARAAFLDRDGTVTKSVAYYITKPSQVELVDGAAEGIRLLRAKGYRVVIITNQAGVAKGILGEKDLAGLHEVMRSRLAAHGASVDAIYYCPHHPEGLIERYTMDCDCRKPKPGLLVRAAEEMGLDLASSVMIGDTERDVVAGKAVGCETFLVKPPSYAQPTVADHVVTSLLEAARLIRRRADSDPEP